MTLRGRGQGRDANFNMNFEPSFSIVGLELVSTRSYTMSAKLKINVNMTLGGRGQGRDANFNMNFEPSFSWS